MKARCKDCMFFLKEIGRCSVRKTKHALSPGKPRVCVKFNAFQQKVKSVVPIDKKTPTKEISASKPDILIPEMLKVKKKGFLGNIKSSLGKLKLWKR